MSKKDPKKMQEWAERAANRAIAPVINRLEKHGSTRTDEEMVMLVSNIVTALVYRMVTDSLSVTQAEAEAGLTKELRQKVGEQFAGVRSVIEDSVSHAFEVAVKHAANQDTMYLCRITAAHVPTNSIPC